MEKKTRIRNNFPPSPSSTDLELSAACDSNSCQLPRLFITKRREMNEGVGKKTLKRDTRLVGVVKKDNVVKKKKKVLVGVYLRVE